MKSIYIKYFLEEVLMGLNFIAMGYLCQAGDNISPVMMVVCGIIVLGCFLCSIMGGKMKYEPEDEMTKLHLLKARAGMYRLVLIVLSFFGMFIFFKYGFSGNVPQINGSMCVVFYICGVLQIVEYIIFLLIERIGDAIE